MQKKFLICSFSCVSDPDRRFGGGRGGESELGWNMVFQISKLGESHILTDLSNKTEIEKKIKEYDLENVVFHYIVLPKFLLFTRKIIQIYAYLWQIKAYFVAKKLHKKIKFDVFHHVTYANDWMASFIGALLPIPYIRGPGGGAHRVPKEFVREYSFKNRFFEKIRSFGQWIFRHDPFFIISQNKAEAILVCNKEAFGALSEKWRKKAHFFPVNGVSKEDLMIYSQQRTSDGKFCVITAGKLLKIKSFDLAIKAFAPFSAKNQNSEFVIVGNGPEFLRLKKLAEKLKVSDKVKFEKWMSRVELLQKIAASDLFLFPSLRDGGGQVVIEAMATGKPVVCFDIAGPGFHIDENCGIKIKPENPEQAVNDMAKALEKLYFDKDLLVKLGRGGKEKAEKEYDWDKLGNRLNEIYKKVL